MVVSFQRPHFTLPIAREPYDGQEGDSVRTVYDLLEKSACLNPDHIFVHQVDRNQQDVMTWTHKQFLQIVDQAAIWLVTKQIAQRSVLSANGDFVIRGKPIGILLGSDIGIFMWIVALSKLGHPFALLSTRLSLEAVLHLTKQAQVNSLLSSQAVSSTYGESLKETVSLTNAPSMATLWKNAQDHGENISKGIEIDHNDCRVAIFHSSGTTGLPKAIFHCHRYMLGYANCHELKDEQVKELGVNVSTLPLYHGYGLLGPSLSLSVGLPILLPSAATIPSAAGTVKIVQNLSGVGSLFTVPSILDDIIEEFQEEGVRLLASLSLVVVGGAPIKHSLGKRLVAAGVNLLNHFGATESGAFAPICYPPSDYDFRYLILRQGHNLQLRTHPSGHFQLFTNPFGWEMEFSVQDALDVKSIPSLPGRHQVKVKGRTDDLIVLATGEKVSPALFEQTVRENELVNEVVMVGSGRFQTALIVEINSMKDNTAEEIVESIWPAISSANALADAHARVEKQLVLVTFRPKKALVRTVKGSIERKSCAILFENELDEAYLTLEKESDINSIDQSLLFDASKERIRAALINLVVSFLPEIQRREPLGVDEDFFERGMDSLCAAKLRRALQASVGKDIVLTPSIVFKASTIASLTDYLLQKANNVYQNEESIELLFERRYVLDKILRKVKDELHLWNQEPNGAGVNVDTTRSSSTTVLLTGSTGNLGSHILIDLLRRPAHVDHVFCLNRPQKGSNGDQRARQIESFASRGLNMPLEAWSRVTFFETCTADRNLGLEDKDYQILSQRVTHIIHNAWPMDFNRSILSFEPHLKATARLIKLCKDASQYTKTPIRLAFISSISVVGHYKAIFGSNTVPEAHLSQDDLEVVPKFGYPEAKFACERLLADVKSSFVNPMVIRVGQLACAEKTGVWSTSEHIALMMKSSLGLGYLPHIKGTASWIPTNQAATVVNELLLLPPRTDYIDVVHLENPSRNPWSHLLYTLESGLNMRDKAICGILPFRQWVDKVAQWDDIEANPAKKILGFLQSDFTELAAGGTQLDMTVAQSLSPTLRSSTKISDVVLLQCLQYWQRIGFLP